MAAHSKIEVVRRNGKVRTITLKAHEQRARRAAERVGMVARKCRDGFIPHLLLPSLPRR
jgi:hypothetical protein